MTLAVAPLHALMPLAIGALVAWRVARRVRRLVGRQPVRLGRLAFTLVVFPLLVVVVGLAALHHPDVLAGFAAGVALGSLIAIFALRKTRYEVTDAGLFYTPNTAIGLTLAALFVGRVLYRIGALYLASDGTFDARVFRSFGSSPLTLSIFGLLAGYYVAYAIGIERWRRSAPRAAASAQSL